MAFEGQRNPYKGKPERPWIRVQLATNTGGFLELDLLADTGNPCALIIGAANMAKAKLGDGPDVNSNFGALQGGQVQVVMPEVGLVSGMIAYASDGVSNVAKLSHPDFEGLAGLPLLRMAEYGGDSEFFWFKSG